MLTPETLLPYLGPTGVFGVMVWWIRHTHKDAIRAHDQRAEDWKAASKAHEARADELLDQLLHVLGAVNKNTAGS